MNIKQVQDAFYFFKQLAGEMYNNGKDKCTDENALKKANALLVREQLPTVQELSLLSVYHLIDRLRSILICSKCTDPLSCPVQGAVFRLSVYQGFLGGGYVICPKYLTAIYRKELLTLLEEYPELLEKAEKKMQRWGKRNITDLNFQEIKELYAFLTKKLRKEVRV